MVILLGCSWLRRWARVNLPDSVFTLSDLLLAQLLQLFSENDPTAEKKGNDHENVQVRRMGQVPPHPACYVCVCVLVCINLVCLFAQGTHA